MVEYLDALKANLIEYEEKYELCKAENAETAKQLEKLTNDFENLRVSFESTKDSSSFDSVVSLNGFLIISWHLKKFFLKPAQTG